MDLLTLLGGILSGTALTKLLDFVLKILKNRKDNYDNWQEDREFFRREFRKMQQEITELYSEIATLRNTLIKNNIPLPAKNQS
jgi:hypothetical protein